MSIKKCTSSHSLQGMISYSLAPEGTQRQPHYHVELVGVITRMLGDHDKRPEDRDVEKGDDPGHVWHKDKHERKQRSSKGAQRHHSHRRAADPSVHQMRAEFEG